MAMLKHFVKQTHYKYVCLSHSQKKDLRYLSKYDEENNGRIFQKHWIIYKYPSGVYIITNICEEALKNYILRIQNSSERYFLFTFCIINVWKQYTTHNYKHKSGYWVTLHPKSNQILLIYYIKSRAMRFIANILMPFKLIPYPSFS